MGIFKAYDIRGVYGRDLDQDTFYRIARAYAQFAGVRGGRVVVGRDCRKSSDALFQAFAKGLVDEGVNVLSVTLSEYELPNLRRLIARFDPHAFVVVKDHVKVYGNYLKKL